MTELIYLIKKNKIKLLTVFIVNCLCGTVAIACSDEAYKQNHSINKVLSAIF